MNTNLLLVAALGLAACSGTTETGSTNSTGDAQVSTSQDAGTGPVTVWILNAKGGG